MTREKIIEILKENLEGYRGKYGWIEQFAEGDYDSEELGLGKTKIVFRKGGEDKGSDWRRVIHFIDHDIYLEVHGWYSSYQGVEFEDEDCIREVRPQETVITVYK